MADGYILDFEESVADLSKCYKEAFSRSFGEFKIEFEESRLQEYVDTPLDQIFGRYYTGCTCKYRDFVTVYMSAFDRAFPDNVEPRPGIVEKLKQWKSEGKKIGVVGDTYGMYIGLFLSKFGIEDCISAVIGIEQMAIPRPDPYSIKLCLAQMGTECDNTVMQSSQEKNKCAAKKLNMLIE
ncbi:MAG: HAD family hydrolase [archaeon]|nr:HAD family hydrolase [archaeon]